MSAAVITPANEEPVRNELAELQVSLQATVLDFIYARETYVLGGVTNRLFFNPRDIIARY